MQGQIRSRQQAIPSVHPTVSLPVHIFVPHHPPPLFLHTFLGHQRGTTLGEGALLLWSQRWRLSDHQLNPKNKISMQVKS